MRRTSILALGIGSMLALGGCAYGDPGELPEENGDERVAEANEELYGKIWSPWQPQPSTLTFYENADFTGAQYSVQLSATTNENVRLIPKTEIEAQGMLSRISSVRLSCGARAANVSLFDAWNTSAGLDGWSPYSKGHSLGCSAGQIASVNLDVDVPELANRVASAYFVNHANLAVLRPFGAFVKSNWIAGLQDLPDGATAKGEPVLQLTGSAMFTLRQNFILDDAFCGDRGAYFTLSASMNQSTGTFTTWVGFVYVDTGWGDAWGCRSKMKSALTSAANDAADQLDAGLEALTALVGSKPRYYLFPGQKLADFDIGGGGGSDEPVFVAK